MSPHGLPETGKRVLFLSHAARHGYLMALMRRGRERFGWRVSVLLTHGRANLYAGLVESLDDCYAPPNPMLRQPWEDNAAERAQIRDIVAASERATGIPLNRVILAGERALGRAYGREFYRWPTSKIGRAVLRDNTIAATLAERIFASISGVLDRVRPDFIVAGQVVSVPAFATLMLARQRGIAIVINRPSKILSGRSFWTTDVSLNNASAAQIVAHKRRLGSPVSDAAQSFLAEFRNRPRTVAYIQRNWDVAAAQTWVKPHLKFALMAAENVRNVITRRSAAEPHPVLSSMAGFYRTAYLSSVQQRLFRRKTEAELRDTRYVLLALHKEPELAINFQHPLWHSQKNLIAWLSCNLPAGYRLLVREHRFNRGRRPTSFYKDILAYPGVELIDGYDPQFKYILNADLIVTDNGTTGWEGLIFRKRVITLGSDYYSPAKLASELPDPSRLGEVVVRRLSEPDASDTAEWDRQLGWLIDAEFETTQAEEGADLDTALERLIPMLSPSVHV